MNTSSNVKKYYDKFSTNVLLNDFQKVNLRHDAIKELCKRFICKNAKVLEIGCGVGIISKYLQKLASLIVSVDISEVNVQIAKIFAKSCKSEFLILDIIENGDRLKKYGQFDAVLLPDVLEHIPKDRYVALFGTIEKLLGSQGRVLVTVPSPQYQEWIKAHNPKILQVIDETVSLSDILGATSLQLLHYGHRDLWCKNQYLHIVLQAGINYTNEPGKVRFLDKLLRKTRNNLWRWKNFMFLRRITRVLRKGREFRPRK